MPNIETTLGDSMVAAHTFRFISPELTATQRGICISRFRSPARRIGHAA